MTIKKKLIYLCIAWVILSGATIILTFSVNSAFILVMPVLVIAFSYYSFSLRCKNCNTPAIRRTSRFLGTEFEYYSIVIDEHCSKCGQALD